MGKRAGVKRAGLLLLGLLLLLPAVSARGAEEPSETEELTARCALSCTGDDGGGIARLTDGKLSTACRMGPGDRLTVRADRDMGTLCLRFCQFDSAFFLLERGETGLPVGMRFLRTGAVVLNLSLKPGCRWVELYPLGESFSVCEAAIYGVGPLPETVPDPGAPLEKADFLLVATHPDDEWVYLGGVYPLYGGQRSLRGTVVYVTLPNWERAQECIDGLWIGGMDTHPYFLGFKDVRKSAPAREKAAVRQEDVTLALVRLYRRIKPLVVVTQDPKKGEYGHWQHQLSARAAYDAAALAADGTYDPDSAAKYGTWTVQKVYQHFAQGISQVELEVETPLERYGGKTALEVARLAYAAHRSQRKTKYKPGAANKKKGDIVHFGLTWSQVGPDTGNDLFEHIPAEMLTGTQP